MAERLDQFELIQAGLSPSAAYALIRAKELSDTAIQDANLGALASKDTVDNDDWSGSDLSLDNGGTGASSASDARTNLGLGALAIKSKVNNDDWDGTDLSIANGGTGASTAAGARAALSVSQEGAHSVAGPFTNYYGFVGSGGSFTNIQPTGWSASRSSAGVYVITHNLGLSTPAQNIITVTSVDQDRIGSISDQSANSFTIRMRNTSLTLADSAFNFVFVQTE